MIQLPDIPVLSKNPSTANIQLQEYIAELNRVLRMNLDEIEARLRETEQNGGKTNG